MARITKLPSADYLRERLDYCPATGALHWRARSREHFLSKREWARWNARYAGSVAGMIDPRGYRRLRIDRHRYKAHRLIWKLMTGNEPPETIDHIDGGFDNNAWHNLRAATQQQQTLNTRLRKDNPSGYRGVTRSGKKWRAQIKVNGTRRGLGSFNSIEDAATAYAIAARELHGEFYRPYR